MPSLWHVTKNVQYRGQLAVRSTNYWVACADLRGEGVRACVRSAQLFVELSARRAWRVPASDKPRCAASACGFATNASEYACDRSRGVRMRTRWRTEDMDRVRLCTRPHPACAFPDACGADKGGTCPTLHTRSYGVCRYGHAEADSGDRASVCAHGTPRRVHSRTMPAVVYQGLAAHKNKSFDVAD